MAASTPITPHAGLKGPTRRTLIAALPAAGVAALLPVAVNPGQDDPILVPYRQWLGARRYWLEHSETATLRVLAEEREDEALETLVNATPSSMEGIAALIHVLWDVAGPSVTPDQDAYLEQADDPALKLIAAIWRAASGEAGLPPFIKEAKA